MVFGFIPLFLIADFIAASMLSTARNVPDETVTILLIIRLLNGRSSDISMFSKSFTELISASFIATLSLLKKYIPRTRHSLISTGTLCLPNSCNIPISVLKSNLTSSMIFPFLSRFAKSVPLNSFETQTQNSSSPIFLSLKHGSTEASFISDKIGPGIPVPFPAVDFEPAISLTI